MNHPAPANLTPYDTGQRLEPRSWWPREAADEVTASPSASFSDDDLEAFGNVDFDDECGDTVATAHISRNEDGSYTLHVIPHIEDELLHVELHGELHNGPMQVVEL